MPTPREKLINALTGIADCHQDVSMIRDILIPETEKALLNNAQTAPKELSKYYKKILGQVQYYQRRNISPTPDPIEQPMQNFLDAYNELFKQKTTLQFRL